LIYGMHHCFNAVTEAEGYPGAVLVRAVMPLQAAVDHKGSGPALVCRALRIDRSCNGQDLTSADSGLVIEDAEPVADPKVRMGARIGVDYAGAWAAHPFRLWIADEPHVSRRDANAQPYDARVSQGCWPR
jgi:DNA-3-methyladenine glycosylase